MHWALKTLSHGPLQRTGLSARILNRVLTLGQKRRAVLRDALFLQSRLTHPSTCGTRRSSSTSTRACSFQPCSTLAHLRKKIAGCKLLCNGRSSGEACKAGAHLVCPFLRATRRLRLSRALLHPPQCLCADGAGTWEQRARRNRDHCDVLDEARRLSSAHAHRHVAQVVARCVWG